MGEIMMNQVGFEPGPPKSHQVLYQLSYLAPVFVSVWPLFVKTYLITLTWWPSEMVPLLVNDNRMNKTYKRTSCSLILTIFYLVQGHCTLTVTSIICTLVEETIKGLREEMWGELDFDLWLLHFNPLALFGWIKTLLSFWWSMSYM